MATQKAPTPVIKGQEAVKIYKEVNRKSSGKSKTGVEKLNNLFKNVVK